MAKGRVRQYVELKRRIFPFLRARRNESHLGVFARTRLSIAQDIAPAKGRSHPLGASSATPAKARPGFSWTDRVQPVALVKPEALLVERPMFTLNVVRER